MTLALVLVVGLGGCSGDDEPDEPASGPSATSAAPAAEEVRTRVRIGTVSGRLPPQARKRVVARAGEVVVGWAEAAYLSGDYPRRDFRDSWPGFTRDAARRARVDRALMSNQRLGERIDGVEPRLVRVRLDVLAPRGRAVGVTARVSFRFATTGEVERDVRVRGRLFLTPTDRGWKVFGYDVTRGAV